MSKFKFPDALIFSIQRSGTKVLLDSLNSHLDIHGCGEVFFYRNTMKPYVDGKINIGILMWNQMSRFLELNGKLGDMKIIHLLRNPENVAISKLQLLADKEIDDSARGHSQINKINQGKRGEIDHSLLYEYISKTRMEQNLQKMILSKVNHITINYEDFVKNEQNIEYLNEDVAKKILRYLNLEYNSKLYTKYMKTGIFKK